MDSLQELWNHVLNTVLDTPDISQASFNLWFKDLTLLRLTEDIAYVGTPVEFKRQILTKRYSKMLEEILGELIGFDIKIAFISTEDSSDKTPDELVDDFIHGIERETPKPNPDLYPEEPPEEPSEALPIPNRPKNKQEYTFSNFIAGNTNKFARNLCMAVAKNPATDYNPLFIYGDSGLGKTHLLFATMNELLKTSSPEKVLYVRGEDFTNQMVDSLTTKRPMQFFREKYRNVNVLLVDDIQFISGKLGVQEEFFHTFEALYQDSKQIIISSDRPPKDMPQLENRLKTRFEMGVIVDIQPPDLELRIAILKSKCKDMGIELPMDVIIYFAEQIKDNIRQLEGAIKKINAFSFLNGGIKIDLALAKSCIQDILSENEPMSVTVEKILVTVSNKYGVSIDEMKSKKRTKEISAARHCATYILRKLTDLSLNDIARIFSQNHSSVLFAINSMEREVKNNPSLEHEITTVINEIKA